jgi:uncharacterized protein (DUF1330 family)
VVARVEVPVTTILPVVVAFTAVRLVVDAVTEESVVVVAFPTTRLVREASVAVRDEMKELLEVLLEATRLVVVAFTEVKPVKTPVTAVKRVEKNDVEVPAVKERLASVVVPENVLSPENV